MDRYRYIGYLERPGRRNSGFVVPIFEHKQNRFRSIIRSSDSIIKDFFPISHVDNFKDDPQKGGTLHAVEEKALYVYLYKGKLLSGTKADISPHLINLIRKESLDWLEKYDIYYFLGDIENAREAISSFLETASNPGLTVSNFVLPEYIEVDTNTFSHTLLQVAKLLQFRSNILPFEKLFKANKQGFITVLSHCIQKSNLISEFGSLINKYPSPFYKDLVVHCYMQNQLDDIEAKSNPEYKLRELIPVEKVNIQSLEKLDVLQRNTQSVYAVTYNVAEIINIIEKELTGEGEVQVPIPDSLAKEEELLNKEIDKFKMELS